MKCDKHTMLLYAVTDRAWVGEQTLYQQVESALKGGATCVQLREKQLGDADFLQEAIQIHALCQQYGVPLFINDNVEVALQCHAEGIHVGQDDMAAAQVRQRVGDGVMIGVPVRRFSPSQASQNSAHAHDSIHHNAVACLLSMQYRWLRVFLPARMCRSSFHFCAMQMDCLSVPAIRSSAHGLYSRCRRNTVHSSV